MKRIQKLLSGEYSDFEEVVLIESPFAQVTVSGHGIRQVQLALTPTKLIIAHEVLEESNEFTTSIETYHGSFDAETETLEIHSIIPLEMITLKIYRKGNRQILKVCTCVKKENYYEFGGFLLRTLYWNIWRDRVRILKANQIRRSPENNISITSSDTECRPQTCLFTVEVNNPQTNHIIHSIRNNRSHSSTRMPTVLKEFLKEINIKSNTPTSCESYQLLKSNTAEMDNVSSGQNNRILREMSQMLRHNQSNPLLDNFMTNDQKCHEYLLKCFPSYGTNE